MTTPEPTGEAVLLMTYGSPASLDRHDIAAYLSRVRGGRQPDDGLVTEFERRYRLIGGSPLIPITESQAEALESQLGLPVEAGMIFSEPSIAAALRKLADRGASRVAAIVLSPQFSPLLMGGYGRAVDAAAKLLDGRAWRIRIADAWHLEPGFVEAVAGRIRRALAELPNGEGATAPVLLTAHSLPRRVADQEPEYLGQLRDTALAIAARADLVPRRWEFCWQSAGHEPGEWMTPDFADLMPALAVAGHGSVVVAPVQFLADHLEVLYDIDVGARAQAEAVGLRFARIDSLNDAPDFVAALASVARATLSELDEAA